MSNNLNIAKDYSIKMKSLMADTGVWISDNLGMMPRSERKAILKVYKKHFNIVEYTPTSGVCKCTNGPSTVEKKDGNYLVGPGEGGDYGQAVKVENIPDMTDGDVYIATVEDAINTFR